MAMTTDDDNGFSISKIIGLRSEAHATIRLHAAEIISLSSAITDVDAALVLAIDSRSVDEQQALVTAARRLADLLDGSGVAG